MAFYPMDSNGRFFSYPEADIPWREKDIYARIEID